jgi:hypothetical protein
MLVKALTKNPCWFLKFSDYPFWSLSFCNVLILLHKTDFQLDGPCSSQDSNLEPCEECWVHFPIHWIPKTNSIVVLNAHTPLRLEYKMQALGHNRTPARQYSHSRGFLLVAVMEGLNYWTSTVLADQQIEILQRATSFNMRTGFIKSNANFKNHRN